MKSFFHNKKNIKILLFSIFLLFAILFICRRYSLYQKCEETKFIIANNWGNEKILDLSKMVPGKWDELLIIGPYMPREDVEKLSGLDIKEIYLTTNAEKTIFAFYNNKKLQKYIDSIISEDIYINLDWSSVKCINNRYNVSVIPKDETKFIIFLNQFYNLQYLNP